nr:hypothetical protein Q903MT_gene6000 [Picea sitchensis]
MLIHNETHSTHQMNRPTGTSLHLIGLFTHISPNRQGDGDARRIPSPEGTSYSLSHLNRI